MAPKRGAGQQAAPEDPAKRFRSDVGRLFLDNVLSGQVTQHLAASASSAGARGVADLAKVGASGKHAGNCARDLLSRLAKGHRRAWGPFYYASVPLLNLRTGEEETKQLPFLLPHVVVYTILKRDPGMVVWLGPKEEDALAHCSEVARELKCLPGEVVLPLGLHGDGVPFNAQRTKSIEIFSWNFTGLPWPEGGLRVPMIGVPKQFVAKGKTFETILAVFAWSMRLLAIGSCPTRRHDGRPLTGADPLHEYAGHAIGCRACLFEIRGDWSWFKSTLQLPGWQDSGGCCWLCKVTPAGIRDTDMSASWRTDRLEHMDFLARCREQGHTPCELFSLPGVRNTTCRPDWLHCVDLGVAADALANIMLTVMDKFAGTMKQRCERLWKDLQEWYRRTGASAQLDYLSVGMLVQPRKAPKLRCKGAEARSLVPFCKELAERHLREDNEHERAVLKVAVELDRMYGFLRLESFNPAGMSEAAEQLASTWVRLEETTPGRAWRVKPKLHLALELCTHTARLHGSPTLFWCYKDEDAGGRGARATRRRGGKQTALSAARALLLRFVARHSPPSSAGMRSARARP